MKRLICWMIGHEYKLERILTRDSRKLCCTRCNLKFAMNDRVKAVVPWTPEFEQFYMENLEILREADSKD